MCSVNLSKGILKLLGLLIGNIAVSATLLSVRNLVAIQIFSQIDENRDREEIGDCSPINLFGSNGWISIIPKYISGNVGCI